MGLGWRINDQKAREMIGRLTVHENALGGSSAAIFGPMGSGKTTLLWHFVQAVSCIDPLTHRPNREKVLWRGRDPIDYWVYNDPAQTQIYVHMSDSLRVSFDLTTDGTEIKLPLVRYTTADDLFTKIMSSPKRLHVIYEPRNFAPTTRIIDILDELDCLVKVPKKVKSAVFWFELIETILDRKDGRSFLSICFDEVDQVFPGRPKSKIQYHLQEWLRDKIVDTRKRNISIFCATHNWEDADWRIMKKLQFKIWGANALPPKRGSVVSQKFTMLMPRGRFIIEGEGFGQFDAPPIPELPRAYIQFLKQHETSVNV